MYLRRKLKSTKGITLIALVITIVVLIILATVTINIVINGGIFSAAREARLFQANAERYDQEKIDEAVTKIEEITGVEIENKLGATDILNSPTTYYGKTVNYSANEITDWKIFYANNNNIFLIASEYLEASKIPANIGVTARNSYSVDWATKPVFQNEWSTYKESFMHTQYTLNSSYYNSCCMSTLLNTNNWTDFVDSRYADLATGGATAEMWIASWNEMSNLKIKLKVFSQGVGYSYVSNDIAESYLSLQDSETKLNTLYFPHAGNDRPEWNGTCGYWLATPNGNFDTNGGYWYGCCVASDYYISLCKTSDPENPSIDKYAIRPLVRLKSGTRLTDVNTGNYDLKLVN